MTAGLVLYGAGQERFVDVYDGPWRTRIAFIRALVRAEPRIDPIDLVERVAYERRDDGSASISLCTSRSGVEGEDLRLVQATLKAVRESRTLGEKVADCFRAL